MNPVRTMSESPQRLTKDQLDKFRFPSTRLLMQVFARTKGGRVFAAGVLCDTGEGSSRLWKSLQKDKLVEVVDGSIFGHRYSVRLTGKGDKFISQQTV